MGMSGPGLIGLLNSRLDFIANQGLSQHIGRGDFINHVRLQISSIPSLLPVSRKLQEILQSEESPQVKDAQATEYLETVIQQMLQTPNGEIAFWLEKLSPKMRQSIFKRDGEPGYLGKLIDEKSAGVPQEEILAMLNATQKVKSIETADGQLSQDNAMISKNVSSSTPGGIDLDPSMLNLQVKRDGNGTAFPVVADGTIQVSGFTPVIIRITPMSSPLLSDK
jgi:hypothetical protein